MTYKRKQGYRMKITERHRVVKKFLGDTISEVAHGFRCWEAMIRACGVSLSSLGKKEADNGSR